MRILIVDDNIGDVELIEGALRREVADVRTSCAFDGVSALRTLRDPAESPPDLVLLDLKLPRKGGFEVLAEMKRDRDLRRVPVVVLSSSAHDADVERAYELQASAYFTKPHTTYDALMPEIIRFFRSARLCIRERGGSTDRAQTGGSDASALSSGSVEQLATEILASVPMSLFSVDGAGRITSWNRAAEALFGMTRDEVLGQRASVIACESHHPNLEDALSVALSGELVGDKQIRRSGPGDGAAPTVLTIFPLMNELGAVAGAAILARDPTKQELADDIFRLAVESSPNALVMVDDTGHIVLVNAETERLFGYSRSELIGSPMGVLVPDRFKTSHVEWQAAFMQNPRPRPMGIGRELWGRRKDGSEVPVEIGLTPVESPDGTFVLSAIVDVSERKLAEERFRLAVESAPSAMVMVDDDGRIVLANRETERLFGYTRSELIGSHVERLVPERLRSHHPEHRAAFLKDPRARRIGLGRELYGTRKDGSEFPVEIGLNPIQTKEGLFVLSAIVDITDRKRAEAALAAKTAELERSNAELEQFAYVASHDLQEPLRMIGSYSKLLEASYAAALDEQGRKYLGYVNGSAARMQQLIRDLLAYARVNRRGQEPAPVDALSCIKSALADLALVIREANARIEIGSMPRVRADENQLAEVFRNLIGNAIKFSPDGAHVRIDSRREGEGWLFSVEDRGIGIEPAYATRIFKVFERLHGSDDYPGTGMGLAICKRIVERLGGHIWMEPNPGGGSIFCFTLHAAP